MNNELFRSYLDQRFGWLRSKLHRTYILHQLVIAAISVLLFFGLSLIGARVAESWHPSPQLVKQHEQSLRNSLIDYIEFNDLSAENSWMFHHWINQNKHVELIIRRDGEFLFSSYEAEAIAESYAQPAIDVESATDRTFEIILMDGPAIATIYYLYAEESLRVVRIGALLVSLAFYLVLSIVWVKKQGKHVNELTTTLESLHRRDYQKNFNFKGLHEIAKHGESLERYRLSRLNDIAQETQAREKNEELIRNMAHDLRTPLTSLIGYLEILDQGIGAEEDRNKHFLDSAKEKASQLREMTNNVFEHFFIRSDQIRDVMELIDGSIYQLQITDLIMSDLEALGHSLTTELTDEPFLLRINAQMIDRVVNNLLSNISRYGDPTQPCRLRTVILRPEIHTDTVLTEPQTGLTGDLYYSLMLCNTKSRKSTSEPGAGIGLANVARIMEAHHGYLRITETRRNFCVRLIFPVAEPDPEGN